MSVPDLWLKRPVGRALRLAVALALLAGACNRPTPTPHANHTPTGSRPSSTAQLAFIEPEAGTVFSSTTVRVRLDLTGATLVDTTTTDLQPDEGHIHLTLDGQVISMTYGLEQDIEAPKGKHLLTAEFVAADHAPFNPRVISTTTFEVE